MRGRRDGAGSSIAAAFVDPPTGGTYADVAGFDVVTVALESSEPVQASLALGALTSDDCDVALEEALKCRLAIPAGFVTNGALALDIALTDASGTWAAAAPTSSSTRRRPVWWPILSEVVIETGGVATVAATTSSVVTVTFVADEEARHRTHPWC